MPNAQRTPVVPLEAGAGPENPPCPACGEPLFGWLSPQPGLHGPVSRCESCGLGVVGSRPSPRRRCASWTGWAASGGPRIANRASYAAALGSAGWAGLEPGARYFFTVESVRRLVARRDQVVKWSRWAPLAGLAATWQTLLNSVTFGHNVALAALGRGQARRGEAPLAAADRRPGQRRAGDPGAADRDPGRARRRLFRRGAVVSLRFELL